MTVPGEQHPKPKLQERGGSPWLSETNTAFVLKMPETAANTTSTQWWCAID